MNRRAIVIGTGIVAVAGFATAAVYQTRFAGQEPPAVSHQVLVRPHSPVIGPMDAPVTIVEFFDPSCEACRAFYPLVKRMMAEFPNDTRLVLRYAPLHEGSDEAIRIIEAARLQDKFLPVLEKLLFEQPQWAVHGKPDLEKAWSFAGAAGLDVPRAKADASSPAIQAVLQQEVADMKAIALTGTPTFFVNGQRLLSLDPQDLLDRISAAVKAAGSGAGAS